jgi:hypothetical protein
MEGRKMTGIKISAATDDISIITIKGDTESMRKAINADMIEIVRPINLPAGLVFICDEEARLQETQVLNKIASWLYGYRVHGTPVVGDVLILKREGPELIGVPANEAQILYNYLTQEKPYIVKGGRCHWVTQDPRIHITEVVDHE